MVSKLPDYKNRVSRWVTQSQSVKVNEGNIDQLLESLEIAPKVKETMKAAVIRPVDFQDVIGSAGISTVSNMWELFNLATYFGSRANQAARSSMLSRSVAWLSAVTSN